MPTTTHTKNPILTLIKYNLRFIYKQLIVFYIIIFSLAIIAKLTNLESPSFWIRFLHEFAQGTTFGFSFGMLINASMRMWAKYRYSIYGDESYLIHTLPLKRSTVWLAEFLTSLVILLLSGLVFLICALGILPLSDFAAVWGDRDINFYVVLIILCVSIFLQVLFIMQAGLTGVTLGHLHNNNPVAHSVLCGIIVYLLGGFIMVGAAFLLSFFDTNLHDILFWGTFQNASDLCKLFYIIDTLYLIFIITTYFINRHLLNRGVNVD